MTDITDEEFRKKCERNARVQARYDELMREGRHGHYETLFRVVREEVERFDERRERNRLDAEDLEACHMAMDDAAIPRSDESGAVYSVWGRACRFAELARQDEREACAKLCEEVSRPYQAAGASVALECAAAIRARSTPTDTTGSKA